MYYVLYACICMYTNCGLLQWLANTTSCGQWREDASRYRKCSAWIGHSISRRPITSSYGNRHGNNLLSANKNGWLSEPHTNPVVIRTDRPETRRKSPLRKVRLTTLFKRVAVVCLSTFSWPTSGFHIWLLRSTVVNIYCMYAYIVCI